MIGFYRSTGFIPVLGGLLWGLAGCGDDPATPAPGDTPAGQVAEGKQIFRHDDFGDWRFWTDILRLHELVEGVPPATALELGLKVDSDAVPPDVLQAVLADPALLQDPAVTRTLLSLDAVVGLRARVENDHITRIGVTCALCHSTVDDAVAPGIGHRRDGWANRDLAVGTIISLTPGLPEELRPVYGSWNAGFFDPRFNVDGISDPLPRWQRGDADGRRRPLRRAPGPRPLGGAEAGSARVPEVAVTPRIERCARHAIRHNASRLGEGGP